jgi:acyl carrier protein
VPPRRSAPDERRLRALEKIKQIHDFLVAEFPSEQSSYAPDENLLAQGIIDSMGLLKLVTFLETAFEIETNDEDLVPENFTTLEKICRFVERKRNA